MKQHLAKLISFVFHPAFLALLIPFLFIFKETASFSSGLKWVLFSAFFLFLALAAFYLARPAKFFSDFDISIRQERHTFYLIALLTAVLYFVASVVFKGIFFPLSIVSLGIILGIVVIDIANHHIKVSIHMAVVTAYTVTIAVLFGFVPFFTFVGVIPLMYWSRLTLRKHTGKELIAGMFLGIGITLATLFIRRSLLG